MNLIAKNKTTSHNYRHLFLVFLFISITFFCKAQSLEGFTPTGNFNEQELTIKDKWPNVIAAINAPLQFNRKGKTYVVFFSLPNGNSIEWTKGKKLNSGDDWHFDIQHIAAQTRFVRALDKKNNYIIVYVMAAQKSWPAWKHSTKDSLNTIKNIVDDISGIFKNRHPKNILDSHSGGGSFIFGYLDAVKTIPKNIERIAFLDSDYGYEDSMHTGKLANWLNQNKHHKLIVLAYCDSLVIFNGKPLVSPNGGTWYRSRLMQRQLSNSFHFSTITDTSFIIHTALKERITFILKFNPQGLIYHTVQVERNGFVLSLLSATKFNQQKYFTYFGNRAYENYIAE